MSTRDECRRAAQLLERLDATTEPSGEATEAEMSEAALHLESCPRCGAAAQDDELLSGIRDLGPTLPGDAQLANSADQIMTAVLAEPVLRQAARPSRGAGADSNRRARVVRTARRRVRWAGAAVALAAGAAFVITASLVDDGPDSERPRRFIEVVSVSGIDPADLAASEDAWLVASYDFFDLEISDVDTAWEVEDLSDNELDSLEGMFGSGPTLG